MSLYKLYRPKDLKSVIGNDETVKSLHSVLERKADIPSAFLFSGPSGCGKTTLARIAASMLGCSGVDLKEIDTADFRGIDTIRELRQQMCLRPIESKCRVYILDECHQLSKDAQSALLKALEDTPRNVYFMLATTEPEKLLITIRNRCSTFAVQSLSDGQLMSLIEVVELGEKIEFSTKVAEAIIEVAKGSARAALVALDSIIDLADDATMLEALRATVLDEREIKELCQALFNQKKWKEVCEILRRLRPEPPEKVRQAIIAYCSTAMLTGDKWAERAYLTLDALREPLHYNGWAGLVLGCYEALK